MNEAPNHLALTFVAPIKPQYKAALKQLLDDLGSDPAANRLILFGQLSQVHVERSLVLDETIDASAT